VIVAETPGGTDIDVVGGTIGAATAGGRLEDAAEPGGGGGATNPDPPIPGKNSSAGAFGSGGGGGGGLDWTVEVDGRGRLGGLAVRSVSSSTWVDETAGACAAGLAFLPGRGTLALGAGTAADIGVGAGTGVGAGLAAGAGAIVGLAGRPARAAFVGVAIAEAGVGAGAGAGGLGGGFDSALDLGKDFIGRVLAAAGATLV